MERPLTAQVFVTAHQSVEATSRAMFKMLRRQNYVTPTNYLETVRACEHACVRVHCMRVRACVRACAMHACACMRACMRAHACPCVPMRACVRACMRAMRACVHACMRVCKRGI